MNLYSGPKVTYDPMDFRPNKGAAIAQIGNIAAQTIASLPDLLRQDKQYQQAEAKLQSEDKIKEAAYTGTNSLLQKMGMQKSVRAPMEGEAKDDYLKYIATEMQPLLTDEQGGVNPEKLNLIKERIGQIGLGENQQLQEGIGRQSFIQSAQADPLFQDMQNRTAISQESPELISALNAAGGNQVVDPLSDSIGAKIDNIYVRGMESIIKRADAGLGSPDALFEATARERELNQKLKLEKIKLEQKKVDAQKAAAAGEVSKAAQGGQPVYKSGQLQDTFNPMDAIQNVEQYSFDPSTQIDPNKGRTGGRGGSGSKKVSSDLLKEYNTYADNVKNLKDADDALGEAAAQGTQRLHLAMQFQDAAGGPEFMDDVTAKRHGDDATIAYRYLKRWEKANLLEELERDVASGKISPPVQKEFERYLTPGAKETILYTLQQGYTLKEYYEKINDMLTKPAGL